MRVPRLLRRRPAAPAAESDPLTHKSLQRDQGAWLLATAAVTLAPHSLHLPVWASILCGTLLAWRALYLWQGRQAPNRLLVVMVALAAAAAVKFSFGHFFGKDPGVALLAILLALKLLEVRAARDVRAAVLLSFFLQLSLFFNDQGPTVAASALTGTLLATISLLTLHDSRAGTAERLRTGATLLAQGLPLMLVLFVLFPRMQGPLWGLPADAYSGRSGLSDSMSPGSISGLSLSDAIAFRAQFGGEPPPPSQRYWRGPVLTQFDGRTWRPVRTALRGAPPYTPAGPRYDYLLTLEPHNHTWLLALDFAGRTVERVRYADDFQLLADAPLRQRARFALTAFPETQVGTVETADAIEAALQLPDGFNPRTREFARTIAAEAAPSQRLARALDHLRRSDLIYTLEPPLLGTHSVDEFLFTTRRGFCEHFAGAFVFLMRAAEVPARVVTGYQGGEINPVDGSLVVRQSDAHAWAEVWLDERGWLRVDPTALAAPRRIESGLAAALPAGEPLPLMLRSDLSWLRSLRFRWEALSNAWNQWVLGYNPERQRELLVRLGLAKPDWQAMTAILGGITGMLMAGLFAWAVIQHRRSDPLDRAWDLFCRKLARRGLERPLWEGPIAYADRLAAARPDEAATLRAIAATYAQLRYRPGADPKAVRALVQRIRRFKPS